MDNDRRNNLRGIVLLMSLATLLGSVGSTFAETPPNPEARRLVELLRYREQFEVAKQTCLDSNRTISAEALQKGSPDYFGDITPADRRWPILLKAYGDYVKSTCEHPTIEDEVALVTQHYSSSLSQGDLRASIAFYASPAGQGLVAAQREALSALYKVTQVAQANSAPSAAALFRQKLQDISRSAGADASPSANGIWVAFESVVMRNSGFYYIAEFLFIAGFLALGWRRRNAGFIVAAIAFVVVLVTRVELSSYSEVMDNVRKSGGDLLPYRAAREDWRFASAVAFLTAALGVMVAGVRSRPRRPLE